MYLETVPLSSIIFFMILCMQNKGLAYVIDGPKCLAYEVITEPPEVVIAVDVKLVIFNNDLPDKTEIEYGQHIKLICDIELPFKTWRARDTELTDGLSEDHTELEIKSVNMTYHREYITCEAKLLPNSDYPDETYGTHIMINNLAPPLISDLTPNRVTVMENGNTTLPCKIVGGVPEPTMRWQFSGNKFRNLTATDDELTIENATFAKVGNYQCIAENAIGNASKIIELVVEKLPVVIIEEGSQKSFPYGNSTEFTCRIEGYPLPKTVWSDQQGNILDSEDFYISSHEKTSVLKLQKLKKSDNYTCFAENTLGNAVTAVNVTVLSPFVVHKHSDETIILHYGTSTTIVCNITSSFPMIIKWFGPKTANLSELVELHTDKNYAISKYELQIRFMGLDMVGKHMCVASLVSDVNEKIAFTTHVHIDDLASPVLNDSNKMIVMEDNWITLYCKIFGGVPPPTLNWQVMKHGDTIYSDMHQSDGELELQNITIADAGKYRCVAKNALGDISKDTDVLVRKAPVVTIDEGSVISVKYGSDHNFTCRVIAYPLPAVEWKLKGKEIVAEDTIIHEHLKLRNVSVAKIIRNNVYNCYANNLLGNDESNINVAVLSPFTVHQTPAAITYVHYAASTNLVCNITSSFPMKIKWYHNSTEVYTSDKHTISTNETVLQVTSADFDMVGSYKCEASLVYDDEPKEAFTTDLQIDDLCLPVIKSHNGPSITGKEMEDLSLFCKIFGVPPPTLNWQVMKHGDSIYSDLHESDEELKLQNITIANAGKYRCVAKNALGEISNDIDVLVRKAPVVTIDEGSAISVKYGSDHNFTCRVIAYPLPTVEWKLKGKEIVAEDTIIHEHLKLSNVSVAKIIRNNVYNCYAQNLLGNDESNINVAVLSPFTVHQTPAAITYVHYAASTNLVCNITSSFPMRIKWYHNSTEVYTSDKHTISTNETVLQVTSADLYQIGSYKCEASLVYDDEPKEAFTTDLQIDDLRPPVITAYNGPSITVKKFEDLSLYCKATGNPEPVVTWTAQVTGSYSRQPVGNGEKICSNNIGHEQAGTYICTATNVAGVDSRTINVSVFS